MIPNRIEEFMAKESSPKNTISEYFNLLLILALRKKNCLLINTKLCKSGSTLILPFKTIASSFVAEPLYISFQS